MISPFFPAMIGAGPVIRILVSVVCCRRTETRTAAPEPGAASYTKAPTGQTEGWGWGWGWGIELLRLLPSGA